MQGRFFFQCLVLTAIFTIALVMELAPWPSGFQSFKPAWIVLVFAYWALSIPHKVNIGWAFIIGIIWDMVLGSTLGVHALVMSLFAYLFTLAQPFLMDAKFVAGGLRFCYSSQYFLD